MVTDLNISNRDRNPPKHVGWLWCVMGFVLFNYTRLLSSSYG